MRREHSRQEAQVSRSTSWLLYLLRMVCVRRAGEGQWERVCPRRQLMPRSRSDMAREVSWAHVVEDYECQGLK